MGCFVRGGKNGMGCFVRGDKNCMGCFVRGGKSMRDVLSGVSKNGMGCFVPGCFVLHSTKVDQDSLLVKRQTSQSICALSSYFFVHLLTFFSKLTLFFQTNLSGSQLRIDRTERRS